MSRPLDNNKNREKPKSTCTLFIDQQQGINI